MDGEQFDRETQRHLETWRRFARAVRNVTIGSVIVLLLMAFFLL